MITDSQKTNKRRAETWFYLPGVDWMSRCGRHSKKMEAELNASLQGMIRKGRGLNTLHDWRSPAYVIREKSVALQDDPVMDKKQNNKKLVIV